jgi:hypothetical protein
MDLGADFNLVVFSDISPHMIYRNPDFTGLVAEELYFSIPGSHTSAIAAFCATFLAVASVLAAFREACCRIPPQ